MTQLSEGKPPIALRPCEDEDIAAVTAIYRDAVLHGTASFEIEPPTESEMRARRAAIVPAFPYLVAEAAGDIFGYAYASYYRTRPAYRFAVEDSIYVRPDRHGLGIGARLLAALIDETTRRGFRQMIAVIGDSQNVASIRLHAAAGFAPAGTFRDCGWKHGRWLDSVFMQRPLGQGATMPPPGS